MHSALNNKEEWKFRLVIITQKIQDPQKEKKLFLQLLPRTNGLQAWPKTRTNLQTTLICHQQRPAAANCCPVQEHGIIGKRNCGSCGQPLEEVVTRRRTAGQRRNHGGRLAVSKAPHKPRDSAYRQDEENPLKLDPRSSQALGCCFFGRSTKDLKGACTAKSRKGFNYFNWNDWSFPVRIFSSNP